MSDLEPASSPETGPARDRDLSRALDLDRIEADLADVEIALARLDSGEYWRDEVTGQPGGAAPPTCQDDGQ